MCGQPFTEQRRPVIDHEHRKGFKKMKQEDKARCVRGLLHNWCNHRLVAKGMTTERAYNIYLYLLEYDERCNDSKNR